MPIAVECETCGTRFAAKDSLAGKVVKCSNCTGPIRIPAAKAASPKAQPSAAGQIAGKCTHCGHPFRVKAEFAGRQGKCKGCGQVMTIPKPGAGKKQAGQQAAAPAAPESAPAADPFGLDDLLSGAPEPFADLPSADLSAGGTGDPLAGGTFPAAGNVGGYQPAGPGLPADNAGGFQPAQPGVGMSGGMPGAAPAKKKQVNLGIWLGIGGGVTVLVVALVIALMFLGGGPEDYAGGPSADGTGDAADTAVDAADDGADVTAPPESKPPGIDPPENSPHVAVIDEMVALLDEMRQAVTGIEDPAGADRAIARLEAMRPRFMALRERALALPDPPKADEARLKARVDQALEKLQAVLNRTAQANPAVGQRLAAAVRNVRLSREGQSPTVPGDDASKLWAHEPAAQVAFSVDGKRMATAEGSSESEKILWDTATGTILRQWTDHHATYAVDFTSDGAALVSVGTLGDEEDRGELCVWDLPACDLRLKASFEGTPDGLAISPDNTKAYVDAFGTFYVIDLDDGETRELGDLDCDFLARRTAFAITHEPGSGLQVYASPEELARDGTSMAKFPNAARISRGACSRNGRYLAGTCHERAATMLVVYDLQSQQELVNQSFPMESEESVHEVFVTCDGRFVFIHPLACNAAYFFDVQTKQRKQIEFERFQHQTLCFTPGDVLLSISKNRYEFHDPRSGDQLTPPLDADHFAAKPAASEQPTTPPTPAPPPAGGDTLWAHAAGEVLAFSPDGKQAVTVHKGDDLRPRNLILWDTATGAKRSEWTHTDSLVAIAIASDGKALLGIVNALGEMKAGVWELPEGKERYTVPIEASTVKSVILSPDDSKAYVVQISGLSAVNLADRASRKLTKEDFFGNITIAPRTCLAMVPDMIEDRVYVYATPEDLGAGRKASWVIPFGARNLACSGDGRYVAGTYAEFDGDGTGKLVVVDLKSRKAVLDQPSGLTLDEMFHKTLVSYDGSMVLLSYDPDADIEADADGKSRRILFDVAAKRGSSFDALMGQQPVAFTPAGIMVTKADDKYHFYDPKTKQKLQPPLEASHFHVKP